MSKYFKCHKPNISCVYRSLKTIAVLFRNLRFLFFFLGVNFLQKNLKKMIAIKLFCPSSENSTLSSKVSMNHNSLYKISTDIFPHIMFFHGYASISLMLLLFLKL